MKNLKELKEISHKLRNHRSLSVTETDLVIELIENYVNCKNFDFIAEQLLKYQNGIHNPQTIIMSNGLTVEVAQKIKALKSKGYVID